MRTFFSMVLVFFFVTCCTNKQKNNSLRPVPNAKELSLLDQELTSYAKELNISGLSYAVVTDDKVIVAKSIGTEDSGRPVTESTVYQIGALAQVFNSVLFMQLSEDEKINLKSTVSDFGVNNKEIAKATIKQILSHTSANKPGTMYLYDPLCVDSLNKVLKTINGSTFSELLTNKITDELNMYDTKLETNTGEEGISSGCVSTVLDLAEFSMAIDQNSLFESEKTTNEMFRPVFLENGMQSPASLGWMVQYLNDKKYVWSFGQTSASSSLIIKSLSDSVSFIILANSSNLNGAFDLQKGNMLVSPIITAFIKSCILRNDTLNAVNYFSDSVTLNSALEKAKSSIYRDLIVNDIQSNIRMQHFMIHQEPYNKLLSAYKTFFPKDLPNFLIEKNPLAAITNVADYIVDNKTFYVENDATVNVYAVGEFVKELVKSSWEYDNVELFFDIKNEKKLAFDNKLCRQYRFNYDYQEITGTFSSSENIKFVQADPSKNNYSFEISIPWKTLNSIKPVDGLKLGFDIGVTNNSGNAETDRVTWHFKKNDQPWSNPSVLGSILLMNKSVNLSSDSLCVSVKTQKSIDVDGKIEPEWNSTPKFLLANTTSAKMPDKDNFSACFRSKWDSDNLYMLVEITDKSKFELPTTSDFGWIENENRDTVWIMNTTNTQYAGGAESNKYVYTTLPLKKGKYYLNYKSNQTNSYIRRTRLRPDISFYGIAVY
jgi:CubicO group peptidase (beta-lactamase class C family)